MLRFKQFIALTEAQIDDYIEKNKHIPLDKSHDNQATDLSDEQIHRKVYDHIPTGDMKQHRWAMGLYQHKDKSNRLKVEDLPSMKDTLDNFNKHKDSLPKKKIEQYKSLGDLHGVLHKAIGDKEQEKSNDSDRIVNEGSTKVYDSPNLSIHHVHNKEASCELGKGMPWCTSRKDGDNMFDHYNATTNNKFYITHLHNEQHPYRKLGIGIGAGEFQDENNKTLEGDDLKKLVARNPELKSSGHLNGASIHTTNDVNKHIHDLLDNDHQGVMDNQHLLNDKSKEAVDDYHKQNKASGFGASDDEHNSVKNSRYSSIRSKLGEFTQNPDILEHLSKDAHPGVRQPVGYNINTPEHVRYHLAMHDPVAHVRGSVDIRDLPKEQQDEIFNNEKRSAVKIKHAGNSGREDFQHKVLDDKNLDDSTLEYVTNRFHPSTYQKIAEHKNTSDETLEKLLHKPRSAFDSYYTNNPKEVDALHNSISKNKNSSSDTLQNLIHDVSRSNTEAHNNILNHDNTTPNHINELARRTSNKDTLHNITKHPKTDDLTLYTLTNRNMVDDPESIKNIINHKNSDGARIQAIKKHKELHQDLANDDNTKSDVLDLIARNSDDPEVHKAIINHKNTSMFTIDNIKNKTLNNEVKSMAEHKQKNAPNRFDQDWFNPNHNDFFNHLIGKN